MIQSLRSLAQWDLQSAMIIASHPWVQDGVDPPEWWGVSNLAQIARENPDLSAFLARSRWTQDDMRYYESWALDHAKDIAGEHPDAAGHILGWDALLNTTGAMAEASLRSVLSIRNGGLDQWNSLVAQDWYRDGLTEEELALVSVLSDFASDKAEYEAWLRDGKIIHERISTSHGPVDLYVARRGEAEDTIDLMRTGVQYITAFMGRGWPRDSIIVLRAPGWNKRRVGSKSHAVNEGHYILFAWTERTRSYERSLYHELGHTYLTSKMPFWFKEGGADLLSYYVVSQTDGTGLSRASRVASDAVVRLCHPHEVKSISEALRATEGKTRAEIKRVGSLNVCRYALGLALLSEMHEALGQDALSAMMRDVHQEVVTGRGEATERDIYEAFLEYASQRKVDKVYRHWWGGMP